MRHLPKLHLLLLVLTWLFAMTWGTAGLLGLTAVLLAVELAAWRADLVRLPAPRRVRREWRQRRPDPPYAAVSHAIALGAHSGREFDFGMRRRLQRVASTRLADGHGVDLHRDAAAAGELLGPAAWALLDPRRPVSGERSRGGVPAADLSRVVDRLEAL